MTEINPKTKELYTNYVQNNNNGTVHNENEERLLKEGLLFDFNGDSEINSADLELAQAKNIDIDGDGTISDNEKNFLQNYLDLIGNFVNGNIKYDSKSKEWVQYTKDNGKITSAKRYSSINALINNDSLAEFTYENGSIKSGFRITNGKRVEYQYNNGKLSKKTLEKNGQQIQYDYTYSWDKKNNEQTMTVKNGDTNVKTVITHLTKDANNNAVVAWKKQSLYRADGKAYQETTVRKNGEVVKNKINKQEQIYERIRKTKNGTIRKYEYEWTGTPPKQQLKAAYTLDKNGNTVKQWNSTTKTWDNISTTET